MKYSDNCEIINNIGSGIDRDLLHDIQLKTDSMYSSLSILYKVKNTLIDNLEDLGIQIDEVHTELNDFRDWMDDIGKQFN